MNDICEINFAPLVLVDLLVAFSPSPYRLGYCSTFRWG